MQAIVDSRQMFCTHCGEGLVDRQGKPALQLYDEDLYKKSKILKLMACGKCDAPVADKYIECDGTLLLIDLILQSREAYRHVLLNGSYASLIIRIALLALICDGYICWASLSEAGEFFEQEYQFYIMCSKALLALVTFLSIVVVPSMFLSHESKRTMVVGLLLAYSSRFFNLVALLWSSSPESKAGQTPDRKLNQETMWGFIYLLFFISSVRVHQVTQKSRLVESLCLLVLAHIGFVGLLNIESIVQPLSCSSGLVATSASVTPDEVSF